jgi:hypothetical protein
MTVLTLRGREYHRLMASLPTPARALTLSAINADYPTYLAELRDGGAIIVLSDDEQAVLGVLTRDPAVFGDAQLAQQIDDGHLPPLEDLLAMSDRGEGP